MPVEYHSIPQLQLDWQMKELSLLEQINKSYVDDIIINLANALFLDSNLKRELERVCIHMSENIHFQFCLRAVLNLPPSVMM